MAYENLKSAIKQAIKQNGNQEITGNLLQSTLLNIVNVIVADYKFLGFAMPSTVPPTSEEGRLFYFASKVGEYINFPTSGENTHITIGEGLYLFTKEANNDYWKYDILIEIAQTTGEAEDKVMSQKVISTELDKKADKTSVEAETKRAQSAEQAIIYDVSARNDGAVFESLSSLLNSSDLSTLIPTSVRHGGMSIRFIQSSDNKYVWYRLRKDVWSNFIEDWYIEGKIEEIDNFNDVIEIESETGEKIVKVNNNGIYAKKYFDLEGNPIDTCKEIESTTESISFTSDDETQVFAKVTKEGLNAKSYKDIDGNPLIDSNETQEIDEEIIFTSDDETQVFAKVTKEGLKSKGFYDLEGKPIVEIEHDAIVGEIIQSKVHSKNNPYSLDYNTISGDEYTEESGYIFESAFFAPAGKRCKLVISCPGGGITSTKWYSYCNHGRILNSLGYAVLIIQGYNSRFAQDLGIGNAMQPYCNWLAVEEAVKAYNYVIKKYQWIDRNGVYIYGESQGGGMAENIAELSGIPIKGTFLDAPIISLQSSWSKNASLKEYINKIYNIGDTWNPDKVSGLDPITRNVSDKIDITTLIDGVDTMPNGTEIRHFDYNNLTIKKYRATNSPICVVSSIYDNVIPYSIVMCYIKACQNGGQPIIMKKYDCWDSTNQTGHGVVQYTSICGQINGINCSVGLVAVLDFFNRCGGYSYNINV